MIYRLIKNLDDQDIPIILSAYKKPSISQFISIDEENYWKYITSSDTSSEVPVGVGGTLNFTLCKAQCFIML